MSTFTYTLEGTTVNPVGEWTIDYQRNAGQIFFRRVLRGDLTFIGDDYTLITGQSVCTDLEFKILCDGAEYWVGSIKYPYGFTDVDDDSCFIVGTPEVVDEYTCIMQNYETEYDVVLAIGGLFATLGDCLGGVLHNFTTACYPIGISGAGGAFSAYLNHILNYTFTMNCGLTLRSSYLWRDNFPNGTNYAGAYGANNYITGVANRLENVYLMKNSDIRLSFGGTACDTGEVWTFKEFEDYLRVTFNAYWYIDENGDFRIEHIHFFDADFPESDFDDGVDLTALGQRCLPTYASRKNKYTYLTDQLFDQEVWQWQHYDGTEGTVAHGTEFTGAPIYYNSTTGGKYDCVPGALKEKVFSAPNFWSDIYWAFQLIAAGTIPTITCPKGLCMMELTNPGVSNVIRCEAGQMGSGNIQNGHLSTANLIFWYHTWDRVFTDGWINGNGLSQTFDSVIRKELQTEIEFPWCCEDTFDPLDFIITELGSGAVYSAELSRLRKSLIIELTY